MKANTQPTVAILRKTPRTSRRSFLKQTGGLTLASAFGLGFVANKQKLLAADSGGSPPPPGPPPPPPPPPSYYLTYVYSSQTGLATPTSGAATGLGSFQVHLQISMDPEPDYTNESSSITVTYRARVWTTGGNAQFISGYSTAGYPRIGQSWPFPGVSFGGGGGTDVAKEAKAEITVTYSANAKGKLVVSGGENWVETEEEKMVATDSVREVRIRKVVSHVQIKRNGLTIEARGWVGHMFDGFRLDNSGNVSSGIQNDLNGGVITSTNHSHVYNPPGGPNTGMPFTRTYQVFGPYAH